MAIQKRNDELVNLLTTDFQKRYEPQFAWGNVCSMMQLLPGLRGFWPMSACSATGNAYDQSGQGRELTYNGNPVYGMDLATDNSLAPYIRFDGTGDYLSRADEAALDITGTETLFASQDSSLGAARGLTMGGWFRPENAAAQQVLMGKWINAPQRSYLLTLEGAIPGDPVLFYISDDGTNYDLVGTASGYATGAWQFVAGRFNDHDTGAELAVWLNGTKATDATARNSIHSGTDDFAIGATAAGVAPYTGRALLCFLCAAALPDVVLWALYQQSRALFGV